MIDDPLIPLDLTDGGRSTTLPGVLAALARDEVEGFPGLLAHQRHGWFLFLAQLGAIALHRAGLDRAPEDEAAWRSLLLALTEGELGPWRLIVPDLGRPAFLQPPIGKGSLDGYALLATEPDGIDVLVTAKAHDVKPWRIGAAEPHHWLYALLTLQTMQGYSGKMNYGIARMNGGFASRPLVELTASRRWGQRFRRALRIARESRQTILEQHPDYYHGDVALLWLQDWSTECSLSLRDLDPFFIEICRRVRLVQGPDGRIQAWGRNSDVPRVAAKDALGNLGDPWIPVSNDGKALTVGAGGFGYELVVKLLDDGSYQTTPSLRVLPADPSEGLWLHLAVLVRGQGETQGLHERWLLVPGKIVANARGRPLPTIHLGEIGKLMIDDAGRARSALRAALAIYLQGGPEKPDWRDERSREPAVILDQRIDRELFFQHFWDLAALVEDEPAYEERLKRWRMALGHLVGEVFEDATAALPAPENRRERAFAKGSLALDWQLRQHGLAEAKQEGAAA